MQSLLVEYSWQTWCGDTLKYPTIVHWALFCLRVRSLEPWTPMHPPFYIPLILMSHTATYIINTSPPCHCAMLWWCYAPFWWETHADAFKHVNRNSSLRVCPLVRPRSTHFYGVKDSDPRRTPWHRRYIILAKLTKVNQHIINIKHLFGNKFDTGFILSNVHRKNIRYLPIRICANF